MKEGRTLRELWSTAPVSKNEGKRSVKKQRVKKLEPIPPPLRSGRVISYENFCNAMNSKHNPALGTPSFVDQWFSFVFEHGNVCPAFSWTWSPKPVNVLPPFQSEEVLSDVSSETIPDSILEGKTNEIFCFPSIYEE